MDQYLLVLDCRKSEEEENDQLSAENTATPCFDYVNGELFKALRFRETKKFGYYLKATENEDDSCKHPRWDVYSEQKPLPCKKVHTKACGDIILNLSDLLPLPGSYILNVYWFVSDFSILEYQGVIGAFRKLKVWHLANFNVFNPDQSITPMIESYLETRAFTQKTIPSKICVNSGVIWRGNLSFYDSDGNGRCHSHNDFSLAFNNKSDIIECLKQSAVENKKEIAVCVADKIWFDQSLYVIDNVAQSSLPLMTYSGNTLILTCPKHNLFGQKIYNNLLNQKHPTQLLCSLDFAVCKEDFVGDFTLETEQWEDEMEKGNFETVSMPELKLRVPKHTLHLLISTYDFNDGDNLIFRAHALNPIDELSAGFLLKQAAAYLPLDKKINEPPIKPLKELDSTLLFNRDSILLEAFQQILKKNKCDGQVGEVFESLCNEFEDQLQKISQELTHQSCDVCTVGESDKTMLLLTALEEREKLAALKEKTDVPAKLSLQNFYDTPKLMMKFCIENRERILDSLKTAGEQWKSKGSIIDKEPHGDFLNYNDDREHSEKQGQAFADRYVSYKTFSSDTTELHLTGAILIDLPGKMSKQDRRLGKQHTPRKRKIIQKLADKLYEKKRIKSGLSMVLRPRTSSCSDPDTPVPACSSMHKMTLRSTPNKNNPTVVRRAGLLLKKSNDLNTSDDGKLNTNLRRSNSNERLNYLIAASTPSLPPTPASQGPSSSQGPPSSSQGPLSSSQGPPSSCSARSQSQGYSSSHPSRSSSPSKRSNKEARARRSLNSSRTSNNKKKLMDTVNMVLADNGVKKDHRQFQDLSTQLYTVSLAYLKGLKSSVGLDEKILKIVKSSVTNVLELASL